MAISFWLFPFGIAFHSVFILYSKRKYPLLGKLWVHCLSHSKVHSLHLATTLAAGWELVYEPSYGTLLDLGRLADETREAMVAGIDLTLVSTS